jgi:hypothetical protein
LRVLGKVLPVIYEAEMENVTDQDYRDVDQDDEGSQDINDRKLKEHFAWHVLWKRPLAHRRAREFGSDGYAVDPSSGRGTGEPFMDPLFEAAEQAEKKDDGLQEEERLPSLTDKLFGVTVDLLFCAGFTIPEILKGPDKADDKINVRISQVIVLSGLIRIFPLLPCSM